MSKTADAAVTKKTILDVNSMNVDVNLIRPRDFYFEHGERPEIAAKWLREVDGGLWEVMGKE